MTVKLNLKQFDRWAEGLLRHTNLAFVRRTSSLLDTKSPRNIQSMRHIQLKPIKGFTLVKVLQPLEKNHHRYLRSAIDMKVGILHLQRIPWSAA